MAEAGRRVGGGRAVGVVALLALTAALATVAYSRRGSNRGAAEETAAQEDLLDQYVRHVEMRTRGSESPGENSAGDDVPLLVNGLSRGFRRREDESVELDETDAKRTRRQALDGAPGRSVHDEETSALEVQDFLKSELLHRRRKRGDGRNVDDDAWSRRANLVDIREAPGARGDSRSGHAFRGVADHVPLRRKRATREEGSYAGVVDLDGRPEDDRRPEAAAARRRTAAGPATSSRQPRAAGEASAAAAAEAAPSKELNWTRAVWLDEERRVRLSWALGDGVAVFKVEARATGWVGLGFSPAGGMAGADMAVAWVDDASGTAHVVDCYGAERAAAPLVDAVQDYSLLRAAQNATHTLLVLRRALDTCDAQHDLPLGEDTARVLWALGEQDPGAGAAEAAQAGAGAAGAPVPGLRGHGPLRRGGRSLHLAAPPPPPSARHAPGARVWNVRMANVTIPGDMDTLYWCKIFRAPPLKRKHHIIGFEPALQAGHGQLVHHMLLFECDWPRAAFARLDAHADAAGRPCYAADMPPDWERCLTPVASWAVGSEGEMLPEHVGLPLAMDDRAKYFMLEVHYDNPSLRTARDSSGLRVYYTEDLRRYDGGVLATGVTVTPLHVIPPRQHDYRTAGYCSGECTERTLPRGGVRLVSVLLHSHLAGRRLRLRHLRAGRALPDVARDDRYDFRFQQSRRLRPEVALLPGDELVTECAYSTADRRQPTFGGYSTKQEMCLAFVVYYPRSPVAACYSMTPVKYFFWAFGVSRFYGKNMDDVERVFLKLDTPESQKGGDNALSVAASTTTSSSTTTTTTQAPQFAVSDPEMAMDEEVNRRAIQVLKKMRGFTEEGVGAGGGEGGGGGGGAGILGDLVIEEPAEFRNKTFREHLRQLPWDQALLTRSLESSLYRGEHMVFCRMPDDLLAIPAAVYRFPNFTEPEEQQRNATCGWAALGASQPGGAAPAAHLSAAAALAAAAAAVALLA